MPITPRKGESQDDFISRCIPVLKSEGKDDAQAYAICKSMWDNRNQYNSRLDIIRRSNIKK